MAGESILYQHIDEYRELSLAENGKDKVAIPLFKYGTPNESFVPFHFVFYCEEYGNAWWPNWGPSSIRRKGLNDSVSRSVGAGGSEEAIIYITRELAQLGHRVEVYADPLPDDHCKRIHPDQDLPITLCTCTHTDNVCWFHHSEFDVLGEHIFPQTLQIIEPIQGVDMITSITDPNKEIVFISWRYPLSLPMGRVRASIHASSTDDYVSRDVYIWLHDMIPRCGLPALLQSSHSQDTVSYHLLSSIPTQVFFI